MASGTWGCTSKPTSPQHQLQQPNKEGLPAAVPTEEAQAGHCGVLGCLETALLHTGRLQ